MNKSFLFLLGILFFISLSSAITSSDIFPQNTNLNLNYVCKDEFTGGYCNELYNCSLTAYYPNGTLFINNENSTWNPTYFNHTLPTSSVLGFYKYNAECTNGTNTGTSEDAYFQITPTGTDPTTSQGIIYFIILAITVGFFILVIYGAIKIPFKNIRDLDGFVVDVNTYKYVKVLLWGFSYILLLAISFILWNIGEAFLYFSISVTIFKFMFFFLAGLTPIVVLITFFVIGFAIIKDSEIKKLLERGIDIR